MLDRMTPAEFDERLAAYRLDPWGDDWRRTAELLAMLENAITTITAMVAGTSLDASQLVTAEDKMPSWETEHDERPARQRGRMSNADMEAASRRRAGF